MAVTGNALGFPLLTIVLLLPGAVGVFLMAVRIDDLRQVRILSVATVVVEFVLAAVLLLKFQLAKTGGTQWSFQFVDRHDWIPSLGITYWIGVDGISIFLVALTALMMAIAVLAATFMIHRAERLFLALMLLLETALIGVFVSMNLFLFFVFWEAMLIPSYFLLFLWGEERRAYATMKFLVYTIFGSFLMLVGVFYVWSQTGTLDMFGPHGIVGHPFSETAQNWLFLAFGLAFAIKIGLFPFHTWAPSAYTESPVPFLIALAGLMSKAGAFGFLRFAVLLFPKGAQDYQGFVAILCIIGMLYAAGLALVQTDIKRLVAYSSISHMNLILLGIISLNPTGFNGSVLQMINHSVIISGLFLFVAYIAARTGTRLLTDMGGLGERWPVLMWVFFVFVLAGLDLPGLSSFAGEFLILIGMFKTNVWFASFAALTVILAAWYMIRFFQNSMNGPVTASPHEVAMTAEDPQRTVYEYPVLRRLISGDLRLAEIGLLVPLVLLILYIGIQPDPLTARINPAANGTTRVVRAAHTSLPSAASPSGGETNGGAIGGGR